MRIWSIKQNGSEAGRADESSVSVAVGANATLSNSVVSGGDVDQSQTINVSRGPRAHITLVVGIVAALFVVTGSTIYFVTQPGNGAHGSTAARSHSGSAGDKLKHTAATLPTYNPPKQFGGTGIDLPGGPPVVSNGIAYSYTDDSLVATRLADGKSIWTVPLPGATNLVSGPMSQQSPPSPGIAIDDQGQPLIIAAYAITIPGSGIEATVDKTRVIAVNSAGIVQWDHTAPAPSSALPVSFAGELHDSMGAAFALSAGYTMVIDLDSGSVRWTAKDVLPSGVIGDSVIGEQVSADEFTFTTVALAGADGSQEWTGPAYGSAIAGQPPLVTLAGPNRLVVPNDNGGTTLLNAGTGQPVADLAPQPSDSLTSFSCLFDGQATIVCWQPSNDNTGQPAGLTIGFDSETGRKLWQIPTNQSQTGVDVTCAYDGLIYGNANGAVVLDARTGAEITVDNNNTAPTIVGPGYGLVTGNGGGATVYLATGLSPPRAAVLGRADRGAGLLSGQATAFPPRRHAGVASPGAVLRWPSGPGRRGGGLPATGILAGSPRYRGGAHRPSCCRGGLVVRAAIRIAT
jgi:hypothetical protein